jgi:putative membrane protein
MFSSAIVSIIHYLAAFTLFSVVVSQHLLLQAGVDVVKAQLLRKLNKVYSISATLLLVFGSLRAVFFAKGWEFYKTNGAFHGKFTLFIILAALSVFPTISIKRWQRQGGEDSSYRAPEAEVKRVLLFLRLELVALLLIIVLASFMANGIG